MKRYRKSATREGDATGMSAKSTDLISDEGMMDFTLDELREFLEADHVDVPASPEFKERLRRKLWDIVVSRAKQRMGS